MSTREFCISRRNAELPAFLRVLKAVPQGKLDYKPHTKSRSAAELTGVLLAEEAALVSLIDTGKVEWKEPPPPRSVDAIAAQYEKHAAAVTERLRRLDEAAWTKKVQFIVPGAPPWTDSLAEFVWGTLFDAVHHRGQLSTYLRPMGGKVPSIYGPSADDPGGS